VAGAPIPREESVRACPLPLGTVRVVAAALAARRRAEAVARERATGQPLCTPDLQREPRKHSARFPLMRHARSGAMLSRAASLRRAFAPFFAKANVSHEQCLSSAATGLALTPPCGRRVRRALAPSECLRKVLRSCSSNGDESFRFLQ